MSDTAELYLILHKVRGEPAYDVAQRLDIGDEPGWIIPTSGHRAYPLTWTPLLEQADVDLGTSEMWANLPDHYEHAREPKGILYHTTARELLKRLGFGEPAMKRRKLGQ